MEVILNKTFKEEDILKPTVTSTPQKTRLQLRKLDLFTSEGTAIGLDEAELYGDSSPQHLSEIDVCFHAELRCTNLEWLTDTGRHHVEKALKQSTNHTSLVDVLRQWEEVWIPIVGKKGLSSRCLMKDDKVFPNGLVLYSSALKKQRRYVVLSMGPVTYKLSRTYLTNFHFRRVFEELVERSSRQTVKSMNTAKIVSLTANSQKQLRAWFAKQMEHVLPEVLQFRSTERLLHDPEDSDLKDPSSETPGRLRSGIIQPPREREEQEHGAWFDQHIDWFVRYQHTTPRDKQLLHFDRVKPAKSRAAPIAAKQAVAGPSRQPAPVYDAYSSDSVLVVSSSEEESEGNPVDDDIAVDLPKHFGLPRHGPPQLVNASKWHCPERGCTYRLDLWALSSREEHFLIDTWGSKVALACLKEHPLSHKANSIAFHLLVDRHFRGHLASAGLEYHIEKHLDGSCVARFVRKSTPAD